jgi:hypothetical protein
MWITLDRVSFPWFFGESIDNGADVRPAIAAAEAFAREEGCTFIFDEQDKVARFGRAYFKDKVT